MIRYIPLLLLILCIETSIWAEEIDVTTSASPQIGEEDSLYSKEFIDYYTDLVDSLQGADVLNEKGHPNKTRVGGMSTYLLNDIPLLLLGRLGGDIAVEYYRVYLENDVLRKIVYIRRDAKPASERKPARRTMRFDDSFDPYVETKTVLHLGGAIHFAIYRDGKLLSRDEDIAVKKKMVETAEYMFMLDYNNR